MRKADPFQAVFECYTADKVVQWVEKKCFTIETRLVKGQFPQEYFEQDMEKQNRIFRKVWKLIQEKGFDQSETNTWLQQTYCMDKRTANTLIQTAKGRLKALRELKKVERADLAVKITALEDKIEELTKDIRPLKDKVKENQATERELEKYRHLKYVIWQKKQKLNRMNQRLARYDRREEAPYFALCFGSKRLFKAQYYLKENGFRSHEGWLNRYRKKRDNQVNYIGSSDEPNGNQNCQLTYDEKTDSFELRIRKDLEFMENEKDKFFILSGLQFYCHREVLLRIMGEQDTPFTFRVIRKGKKWYLQVIFTWTAEETQKNSKKSNGTIGLDFNDGFISTSETDRYGNLIEQKHFPLNYHGTGNRADSEIQEVISKLVSLAKEKQKPIVIEDLNFGKTKAKRGKAKGKAGKKYNKMIHAFDYSRYKKRMENACFRENIELMVVNPAYTSQIGIEKYGKRMKLNRHQAASYVIARKGQGYQDKIPKQKKRTKKKVS